MFVNVPPDNHNLSPEEKVALIASTKSPISFLSKLGQSIAISRKRNPKVRMRVHRFVIEFDPVPKIK